MRRVIVDTGPLVAFLNGNDAHHAWTRDTLSRVEPPLMTCEALLSEACFLLRKLDGGPDALLSLVSRGIVEIDFRLDNETLAVLTLMKRYASIPMSLADACLVRMSELTRNATVMTLDSDFRIYRRHGRRVVAVLSPS